MHHRFILTAVVVLAGCSSLASKPELTSRNERFMPDSPFEISVDVPPTAACDAGRRALLSQGYVIDESKPDALKARKYFQPQRGVNVQINFTLSCLARARDEGESAAAEGAEVFANAREQRDELKATANSAGVSVAGIGSVSLPIGATGESLVKVGDETITDADFYGRFFALMQTYLH